MKKFLQLLVVGLVIGMAFVGSVNLQRTIQDKTARSEQRDLHGGRLINAPRRQIITDTKYARWLAALDHAATRTHTSYFRRVTWERSRTIRGHLDYFWSTTKISYAWPASSDKVFRVHRHKFGSYDFDYHGHTLENSPVHEGDWFVLAQNGRQYKAFERVLLNELRGSGIHTNTRSLTSTRANHGKELTKSELVATNNEILVGIVSIVIINLLIGLMSRRDYAIMRMQGFSRLRIIHKMNGLALIVITGGLLSIYCRLHHGPGGEQVGIGLVLGMLLIIFTSCLPYVLPDFRLSAQLSDSRMSKQVEMLGIDAIKVISIGVCVLIGTPLVNFAVESVNAMRAGHPELTSKYAVVYPYLDGRNDNNFTMADAQALDKHVYNKLIHLGGIFYDDSQMRHPNELTQKTIYVSPSYLRQFPIKDSEHGTIRVQTHEAKIVLILPERMQLYADKFIQNLKYGNSVTFRGAQVYIVPNDTKIYSMRDSKYELVQPIFVTTTDNSDFGFRNFINGMGLDDGLKFPVTGHNQVTFKRIMRVLHNYQMADNYTQMVPLNQMAAEDFRLELGNFKGKLLQFSAMLVVVIVLMLFSALTKVEDELPMLRTKQTFGYGTSRIIAADMLKLVIFYVILGCILAQIGGNYVHLTLWMTGIIGLVDVLITQAILRFNMKGM